MGFLNTFLLLILFSSCAKLGYLLDQASGQLEILSKAKDNEYFLKKSDTSQDYKRKIKLIGDYKKFFYDFFDKEDTGIYSKTYILKDEAVTYLVIASKYNEVNPKSFSFPFVGSFPYLGFFSKNQAVKFTKELEDQDYVTYQRPVYAYSTLGYFEDRILSSFFKYSDYALAELIFHELFHTIYFVKDEVSLNENLANHFGKEMAILYFKLTKADIKKRQMSHLKQKKLRQFIVDAAARLKMSYQPKNTKEEARKILKEFLKNDFNPSVRKVCQDQEIGECWPLEEPWNNARFAAFLTYEKKQDLITQLRGEKSLKEFYHFLTQSFQDYESDDKNTKNFTDYLTSIKK